MQHCHSSYVEVHKHSGCCKKVNVIYIGGRTIQQWWHGLQHSCFMVGPKSLGVPHLVVRHLLEYHQRMWLSQGPYHQPESQALQHAFSINFHNPEILSRWVFCLCSSDHLPQSGVQLPGVQVELVGQFAKLCHNHGLVHAVAQIDETDLKEQVCCLHLRT